MLNTSNQTVLVFIQQPLLSFNTKCLHLFMTYYSYIKINAFTAFLCSKKQSHHYLLSPILYIFIYKNITHANMDSILSGVKIQNLSPLITLFPQLLSQLLSVPQSCASHSSTYIYTIVSCKPIWRIFSVLLVKVAHRADSELHIQHSYVSFGGKE